MSAGRRELAAEIAVLALFLAGLVLPLHGVVLSFGIVGTEPLDDNGSSVGKAAVFNPRVYALLGTTLGLPGLALAGLAWTIRRAVLRWARAPGETDERRTGLR